MSKNQTTTQNIAPWRGAQPIINDAIAQVQGAGVPGFRVNPYTGPRVAEYSPMTMGGLNALAATGGSGITPAANEALLSNLGMEDTYRDFDVIRDTVADNVKANLATTFAGGGINSGLAQDTYSRAMTEALANVEYGAYNDARARQMQALGLAPSVAGLARADAGAQLTAGGMLDDLRQRQIDADMAQYYEEENADMDALRQYSALASGFGGLGSTGATTAPTGNNIFAAGSTGLGTYGALAANPATAGIAVPAGILAGLGSIF